MCHDLTFPLFKTDRFKTAQRFSQSCYRQLARSRANREHQGTVRAENLNPQILVMQPANQGVRYDASDLLNRARDRRILVQ